MSRAGGHLASIALVAVILGRAAPVRAEDRASEKAACATAAEDAQQLRIDAKLKAARDRLLLCTRPECSPQVLRDCSQWMNEVSALMPTVVLGARDAQGRDVLTAQVSIDGVVVARGLDGKALEVDPGAHTFRFQAQADGATTEQAVLIREGEKGRPITVTLDLAPTPAPLAPLRDTRDTSQSRPSSSPVSPWTWVLGGVGLLGLGIGTYLEVSVNSDASNLQSACGHGCARSQVDPLVLKQQVLGPIAFGVGALGLGLAAYSLFAAPAPSGAVAGVAGRF